ncbi:hypothetical protein TRIP_B320024 [uncultured Desulfatiglans sp.]|uniref:Uncharacterized protein n=1 Tax=Uncultured Desulfatiglans sp. TaxID=1748965 RepID=A0A653A6U9_UNCDX|nr:hypothetical protein TRIP_B320024 [uncultured Desulfatiglans sp.]
MTGCACSGSTPARRKRPGPCGAGSGSIRRRPALVERAHQAGLPVEDAEEAGSEARLPVDRLALPKQRVCLYGRLGSALERGGVFEPPKSLIRKEMSQTS